MYSALIVDDEADARNVMRRLIELFCPEISRTAEASDGADAVRMAGSDKFDFAFVDIELNGESGLDIARQISRYCANIIFVTAFDKYAVQAFQTEALHYLLKPVNPELLQQAIRRSNLDMSSAGKFDNRVFLKTKERMTVLRHDEIRYVEGDRNYSTFVDTEGQRHLVSHNLAYYERQIASPRFFRIHQSYLVNLDQVKGTQARDRQGNTDVVLRNGERLPLARSKKRALLDILG